MKISKLKEYLGKYVEVTLYDNTKYKGILYTTDDANKLVDYFKYQTGYYVVLHYGDDNYNYRASHITRIKEIKQWNEDIK